MLDQKLAGWCILLVDDDEEEYILTRSLMAKLNGRKVHLEWASTYEQGRALLQSNQYDAVLVDYDLGPRTGLEFIRETVSQDYPAPLIMYTGRGNFDVDVEAMQAGATMYLTKKEATPLLMERFLRYAIERKRNLDEINHHHQERAELLDSIQDGFFSIDRSWRFQYVNHRAASAGNLRPEDFIGKNIWEMYPKLIGTVYEKNYRLVMSERRAAHFEVEAIYNKTWYSVSVYPSLDGISIFWQDISKRKKLEEEIYSQALFPEENTNPVMRFSVEGGLLYANQAARPILLDSPIGKQTLLSDDLIKAALIAIQDGKIQSIEIDCNGRTFLFNVVPVKFKGYVNLYGSDITSLKQAEIELRESEDRFRAMTDGTPLIMWVTDANGKLAFINRAYSQFFGVAAEQALSGQWQALVHPDDQARYVDAYADCLRQQSAFHAVGRVQRHDGEWRWVESFGQPRFSAAGEFLGLAGSSIEITDPKLAEKTS